MPDFLLELESEDPDRPARHRPPRMVATGLHPTAAVPTPRRTGEEAPPAYAPCAACGQPVLLGETRGGFRRMLDVRQTTYTASWETGAPLPQLAQSRAYPVHRCGPGPGP